MRDPSHPKPGVHPPASVAAKPGAQGTAANPRVGATGKVIHDDRGHAVWQWVKETSRIAIESTSRLLRKLEAPELKMEDTRDEEVRITPDPGAGGGYDPYNQRVKPPRSGRK
jgi:hypothetical protein